MKIEYKPSAVKQIKKIHLSDQKKIIKKLELLSQNPFSGKTLKGELGGLRSIRAWPYRIVYEIKEKSLIVISVAHRQSVY